MEEERGVVLETVAHHTNKLKINVLSSSAATDTDRKQLNRPVSTTLKLSFKQKLN